MHSNADTNSSLAGLSILAARGLDTIQAAGEAILQLMMEQMGTPARFLAGVAYENGHLEVLAALNTPGDAFLPTTHTPRETINDPA